MAWDFAGDIGSSLIGAFASNASAKKQFKYQSALQAQAAALNYEYGIKSLKNSPSAQREGLVTAGYNPMLAVQNSTSGANAGWTSAGQAQSVDYSQSISNALDFQRVKNESLQTDSTVAANNATAQNQTADALNKLEMNPYIADKAKAEIGNINADTQQKSALIDNMKARLELDRQLGFMGLDVQRRGQDKAYNASMYATDSKFASDIYGLNISHPFAKDYVGTLFGNDEVSQALYNSIRKNKYSNPKYH